MQSIPCSLSVEALMIVVPSLDEADAATSGAHKSTPRRLLVLARLHVPWRGRWRLRSKEIEEFLVRTSSSWRAIIDTDPTERMSLCL